MDTLVCTEYSRDNLESVMGVTRPQIHFTCAVCRAANKCTVNITNSKLDPSTPQKRLLHKLADTRYVRRTCFWLGHAQLAPDVSFHFCITGTPPATNLINSQRAPASHVVCSVCPVQAATVLGNGVSD
jgi:hypothetical protein